MYACYIYYKKVYNGRINKLNQGRYRFPRQMQHLVIDLKMELLVKIADDFKL